MSEHEINEIKNDLRNHSKMGFITLTDADAGEFQIAQYTSLGTTSTCALSYPYGVGGSPPTGTPILLTAVLNQESNISGVAIASQIRRKNLKPGEAYLSNLLTKTIIIMEESGNLAVTVNGSKVVTISGDDTVSVEGSQNVTIKGSETVTIEGSSNINVTGSASITAASVTIGGNTTINGDLVVNGAIGATGEITAFTSGTSINFSQIKVNYNGHTHVSNGVGAPTTMTDLPI